MLHEKHVVVLDSKCMHKKPQAFIAKSRFYMHHLYFKHKCTIHEEYIRRDLHQKYINYLLLATNLSLKHLNEKRRMLFLFCTSVVQVLCTMYHVLY